VDHVLLMGSGILVVLAISQLCVPRRAPANNLLCLLSLVCFVWLAHGIGFRLGMLDVYPHLNKFHLTNSLILSIAAAAGTSTSSSTPCASSTRSSGCSKTQS